VVVNGILGPLPIIGHEYDLEREFYVIHLGQDLEAIFIEDYTLEMQFTAILGDQLRGFYRTSYDNDQQRLVALTQFEPVDARRAFPCLDEPQMKATFTISLGHPDTLTARSNMEAVGDPAPIDGLDDYVLTTFQETPVMSTYLLAFLISDFDSSEAPGDDSFKVWHRQGLNDQAGLAASIGPAFINFYRVISTNYL